MKKLSGGRKESISVIELPKTKDVINVTFTDYKY